MAPVDVVENQVSDLSSIVEVGDDEARHAVDAKLEGSAKPVMPGEHDASFRDVEWVLDAAFANIVHESSELVLVEVGDETPRTMRR